MPTTQEKRIINFPDPATPHGAPSGVYIPGDHGSEGTTRLESQLLVESRIARGHWGDAPPVPSQNYVVMTNLDGSERIVNFRIELFAQALPPVTALTYGVMTPALLDQLNRLDPVRQIPAGGDQGQVLTKGSGDDYDAQWLDPSSGGGGGGVAGISDIITDTTGTPVLKGVASGIAAFRSLLSQSTALTIVPSVDGNQVVLAITGANGSAAGLMSSADFTKLAGISAGAQVNPPVYTGATLAGLVPPASSPTPSTAKFLNEAGGWAVPPTGGGGGGGITDVPADGNEYMRKDLAWQLARTALSAMSDVSIAGAVNGQVLRKTAGIWQGSPDGVATQTLASHVDANFGTLNDGDIIRFRTSDNKFHNEVLPGATSPQTDRITKNPVNLVGPTTHVLDSGDIGVLRMCDLAVGDVTVLVNDSISHPSTVELFANFRTVNAGGATPHALVISTDVAIAGGATPAMPTPEGTVGSFQFKKTSGVNGTAISSYDIHNFTVPAGTDLGAVVLAFGNPANSANALTSLGFRIDGVHIPWTWSAQAIAGSAPHGWLAPVSLGTLASPVAKTFQLEVDQNNVNSYWVAILIYSNAKQAGFLETISMGQSATALDPIPLSITLTGAQTNRRAVWAMAKRANTTGLAITQTGADSMPQEGATHVSNLSSAEMRCAVAHKTAPVGLNSMQFDPPSSNVYATAIFAIAPQVEPTMGLTVSGDQPATILRDNQLVTLEYDSNTKFVNVNY